ncbi:hypothetical protein [Crenalkalicoccus roseus]|uniref:hypothetical protein n=1 Tax=Crenalkalicoccus roseus TaxID=1485588 RepID=UPI0010817A84|nr:hypothetical protein [Crenalkalicoccus roseus]
MSDSPENQATPSSGAPARPAASSPAPPSRPMRLDPAAIMIGVGGVVLLLAIWWLWATPRADQRAAAEEARLDRIEQRLDTLREQAAALAPRVERLSGLEQRLAQLAELDGRLRALEQRPAPPDPRPLEQQLAQLAERVGAAERAAVQATERLAAQAEERAAATDRRLQALEGRPAFDPAAVAGRDALEALAARLGERLEALAARQQEILRAAEQREAAAQQAAQQRLAMVENAVEQRLGQLGQQFGQRLAAAAQETDQRLGALERQLEQRLAAVEQAQQRLAAATQQAGRVAALNAVRAALAGGQPLGPVLQPFQDPPPALARFAATPPPTEAALRLSFEEAARAARAASDPGEAREGERAGVMDAARARLGGLVTVRRGEEVIWGDAVEQPLERARRALEAGDLEQALQHLERLPRGARQAMQGWIEQAQALVQARAALREMAAG